jgi:hypothetical protein
VTELAFQRFQGGRGTFTKALVVGLIGTGVALAGAFGLLGDKAAHKSALYAYLIAFVFWAGLALGSLVLLMIFHAFRAKWPVVVRRPLEAMAATLPLFLLLAIPILVFLGDIYSWVAPQAAGIFSEHELHILHQKHGYLNPTWFRIRTVFYLLFVSFIALRLFRLSTQQDTSGDPALTQKQRNLGTGALPLVALVLTFAAFDWLMSLNPLWFSTIFGVYYFAGGFWSSIAMLIIVTTLARGKDLPGQYVSLEHMQNLGKLLFAFTCFWGYIAFSQMMLIWIANLPEETPFYIVRMQGEWAAVGIALIIGHFFVPFAFLLSRDLKRNPTQLSLVAGWALLMNLLDVFWLVMPTYKPNEATPHWSLLFAFVGLGGLATAFGLWKLRGQYTIPVRDPFLEVSLRYRQPL